MTLLLMQTEQTNYTNLLLMRMNSKKNKHLLLLWSDIMKRTRYICTVCCEMWNLPCCVLESHTDVKPKVCPGLSDYATAVWELEE